MPLQDIIGELHLSDYIICVDFFSSGVNICKVMVVVVVVNELLVDTVQIVFLI